MNQPTTITRPPGMRRQLPRTSHAAPNQSITPSPNVLTTQRPNDPITQSPCHPVTLLLALAALLLYGCTDSPYPSVDADKSILYTSLSEDPKSLDPSVSYTVPDQQVLGNICDTYLQYDYLKRDPLVLEPLMGARMPVRQPCTYTQTEPITNAQGKPVKDSHGHPITHPVTKRGERWTFTIKPGLRFADDPCFPAGKGRECTAADFVYAIKRLADPSVNCPILNYILPHVVGLQEFFDTETAKMTAAKAHHGTYTADLSQPMQGVQVDPHDPYTFYLVLKDRYPQLKYLMAMSFTAPIAHEAVEYYNRGGRNELRRHPVGAGPYYLAEWTENLRVVLKQNPYYHTDHYPTEGAPGDREKGLLQDAGKPLPLTAEIVFTIVREPMAGWTLFQQGYMDSWGVPKETFSKIITHQGSLSADMKARGIRLEHASGMDVWYYPFNMQDSVVGGLSPKKRKLRQALSLAWNAQEYLDLMANGLGILAQGPLPPAVFGYDPNYRDPYRQPNLEKAKQLLAEAGYPDGIDPSTQQPLEIDYDNTATSPADYQATGLTLKEFERLGIRMKSRPWTFSAFQDRQNNGQTQFSFAGWNADYPDPENFFLLFYSPNRAPAGANYALYSNPRFDQLYRQMASMEDGPERKKLIEQMRGILQEDCPWIYSFHSESLLLEYDWLHYTKPHPVALNTAKYLRIDSALRARRRSEWNHPRYDVVGVVIGLIVIGSLPAVAVVRRRRSMSARASRRTMISRTPLDHNSS